MIQLSNENNNFKIKMRLRKKNLLSDNFKHQLLTSYFQQVLSNNYFEFKINLNYFFLRNNSKKWIDHGQL